MYGAHAKMAVHYNLTTKIFGFSSVDSGAFCYIWLVSLEF